MTTTVLDHSSSPPKVGVAFREAVQGPERELVNWFITHLPVKTPRGCRLTVFREPKIESGFPDLVAVLWSESVTRHWSSARQAIGHNEIRLIHHLHWVREGTESSLIPYFGRRVSNLLETLCSAGMIRKSGQRWVPRALASMFAVRQIIAIEAKTAGSRAVLDQAFLNTWFASASFVLLPKRPACSSFLQRATEQGLGVWTQDGMMHSPRCDSSVLPKSYASWLFNEWVWRAALHE